jgi:hypothetical protein
MVLPESNRRGSSTWEFFAVLASRYLGDRALLIMTRTSTENWGKWVIRCQSVGRLAPLSDMTTVESLASYRHCCGRLVAAWPAFKTKREERLAQERRFGTASEKVAENILEDLFTAVLDWSLTEFNNQVAYADIVLTRLGIKHLIVEVKRPGALAWNQRSVDAALAQAHRYADEQRVHSVAISDGVMLYARDHIPGGHRDRAFVRLDQPEAPLDLWWLSVDGIYRPRNAGDASLRLLPPASPSETGTAGGEEGVLLHPKYHLPAACFAYVGSAADVQTWHLPYLLADGQPDFARLPKAIQAILSNYRGAHVSSVPEAAIPEVLVTLGRCAFQIGKLPAKGPGAARAYVQLQLALEQLDRLADVVST